LILLDTCAILFAAAGTLSKTSRAASRAAARNHQLFVSPISFWEIATLVRKGRVVLDVPLDEFLKRIETGGAQVAALTPTIARNAGAFDDRLAGDPADRILVATAVALGVRLMTRDAALLSIDRSIGLRVIAC
jgi:PIN domain nuclease of toxin-antitoxin system